MRIIVHECELSLRAARKEWIQEDLKFPIFKETQVTADGTCAYDRYRFFIIIMNEEDLSALCLKYPAGTFKNL
jgi:hypothetical protein